MKYFILILCFCYGFAAEPENLLDDLDKFLTPEKADTNNWFDELANRLNENEETAATHKDDPAKKPGSYGKCLDGITNAQGPSQLGCTRMLCYDKLTDYCDTKLLHLNKKDLKEKCYQQYLHFKALCPFSCNFCKPPSPQLQCRRKYGLAAQHGCCSDGMPALRPDHSDCMRCQDFRPHPCRQFFRTRKGIKCSTNSYRIRTFLYRACPKMCGRCQTGQK